MGRKLYIVDNTLSTKRHTPPITLSPDNAREIENQNYIIHIVISFLIYAVTFFVFYFLKFKSFHFESDNLILLAGFLTSVIVASIFSKKFNYIKHFEYAKTLGKLFLFLVISLCALIIFFKIFKIECTDNSFILKIKDKEIHSLILN